MATMLLNKKLNGVELYFNNKPETQIIDSMKEFKFRWNRSKKCWYAKQSENTLSLGKKLVNNEIAAPTKRITNNLSLWDRTQFTQGNTDKSKYKYNFVGSNYDPEITCKEIASIVRKHLKQRFSEVKFSVTSKYNHVDCDILFSPYENKSLEINTILKYTEEFIESYNFDNSDSQTDYFHNNFYTCCSVGYGYVQTEQTETIIKDIEDFKQRLLEAEQTREIEADKRYMEMQKQRELEALEFGKRQAQDKIDITNIENDITIKELEESSQYMITNVKMANLNKCNSFGEYQEQINKGEYYIKDMRITREIKFNSDNLLNKFKEMLLNNFDFLTDAGGSYTDDENFTSMSDYHQMTQSEKDLIKWNTKGVAIYFDGEFQFVVDAQGYKYARYIGITDGSKIEQMQEDKEPSEAIKANKAVAKWIEDISTEIIRNNNIDDFTKNKEYTELLIDKLENGKKTLTKQIVQQIEIEELKIYLYKLLIHMNSVQQQFIKADIKENEKITIITIAEIMGMVNTSKVQFNSYELCKYAQYNDAIKLICTPVNKRKQCYNYYHSDSNFIIVDGWHDVPEDILWEIGKSDNDVSFKRTKYFSFDTQQLIEIKKYFTKNDIKILIDKVVKK